LVPANLLCNVHPILKLLLSNFHCKPKITVWLLQVTMRASVSCRNVLCSERGVCCLATVTASDSLAESYCAGVSVYMSGVCLQYIELRYVAGAGAGRGGTNIRVAVFHEDRLIAQNFCTHKHRRDPVSPHMCFHVIPFKQQRAVPSSGFVVKAPSSWK
jgi:hypothetical protein